MSEFQSSLPIPAGKTHVVAQVVGTRGTIAPEAYECRCYTEKTDFFSLGVLLSDILMGMNLDHLLASPRLEKLTTTTTTKTSLFCSEVLENEAVDDC